MPTWLIITLSIIYLAAAFLYNDPTYYTPKRVLL